MLRNDSDDDDYMSDRFLPKSGDVRPGLVFKQTLKRTYVQEAKHKECNRTSQTKKLRVLEEEKREEGLQKRLTSGNKGFDLLQKMGYKPGTSLGKSGTDGRTEPLPIAIKSDRTGLGLQMLVQQKREEVRDMKRTLQRRKQQSLAETSRNFLRHQKAKALAKQIEKDLYSSQKSCQQLDSAMELTEPVEEWFWPAVPKVAETEDASSNDDDDEAEVDLEPEEKLEILTSYLRSTHFFCVWCGTAFTDEIDLKENCPGNTVDDH